MMNRMPILSGTRQRQAQFRFTVPLSATNSAARFRAAIVPTWAAMKSAAQDQVAHAHRRHVEDYGEPT